MASMGIAADDANGDGRIDFFVTTFHDEPKSLFLQQAGDSQFICFGHTPGHNSLSAHAVFELRFTLQHQDFRAALGHGSGQCGGGNPAPYRNDVVVPWRHSGLLRT